MHLLLSFFLASHVNVVEGEPSVLDHLTQLPDCPIDDTLDPAGALDLVARSVALVPASEELDADDPGSLWVEVDAAEDKPSLPSASRSLLQPPRGLLASRFLVHGWIIPRVPVCCTRVIFFLAQSNEWLFRATADFTPDSLMLHAAQRSPRTFIVT